MHFATAVRVVHFSRVTDAQYAHVSTNDENGYFEDEVFGYAVREEEVEVSSPSIIPNHPHASSLTEPEPRYPVRRNFGLIYNSLADGLRQEEEPTTAVAKMELTHLMQRRVWFYGREINDKPTIIICSVLIKNKFYTDRTIIKTKTRLGSKRLPTER